MVCKSTVYLKVIWLYPDSRRWRVCPKLAQVGHPHPMIYHITTVKDTTCYFIFLVVNILCMYTYIYIYIYMPYLQTSHRSMYRTFDARSIFAAQKRWEQTKII